MKFVKFHLLYSNYRKLINENYIKSRRDANIIEKCHTTFSKPRRGEII